MEQQLDLKHYVQVLKRRKWAFILPGLAVFVVVGLLALFLPPTYKSSATILIETQEIPEAFIRSTVTGYIEERLQTITQIVLSRKNMLDIIQRFDLYADERGSMSTEELVTAIREDITMEPVQAEVINPQSGRPGTATIAFNVSYQGRHPQKVAQVTNTLVSLYLEENLRARKEKAETTYDFLEKQLASLKDEIEGTEEEIARFKERHLTALPELMQLNLQTMERLQKEIEAKQEQVRTLMDRKVYLEGQLATVEPVKQVYPSGSGRMMTPEEELQSMRNRYLSLKAVKSESHPDVIALKRQIDALEQEVDLRDQLKDLRAQLTAKESEMARLNQRYTAKHPDVIKARREVEELREEIDAMADLQVISDQKDPGDKKPENPAYINLQTQITSTELEIESAQRDIRDLRGKYTEYQRRIEMTPKVEQEYRALQRNYVNAQEKYQETMSKLMAAREAKGLEESAMAEKLTLIDPPTVPEKPFKPNRLALLLIGLVLATGVGVGSGSVAEFMDQSVYNSDELGGSTGVPVLVTVPYLETVRDKQRRFRRRLGVAVLLLVLLAGGILAIHFFYEPLDVLWFRILNRFQ